MIRKKETIDLRDKNIIFNIDTREYKIVTFYQSKMTLDVIELNNPNAKGIQNFPFAHIPKVIKKILKPN